MKIRIWSRGLKLCIFRMTGESNISTLVKILSMRDKNKSLGNFYLSSDWQKIIQQMLIASIKTEK